MARVPAAWHRLPTTLAELCVNTTLRCGQSFRWRQSADDEWSCALHGRIVSLRQDAAHVHYRAIFPDSSAPVAASDDNTCALVTHYLNLAPNLGDRYAQWAAADANFKKRAPSFTGVRILRQDAWEALVAFICSSNNNISRISGMVHNLCLHYGPLIGHIDDTPYHDFPTPEALAAPDVEARLVKLGFGYRAKYIAKTARIVAEEKGIAWLESLANPEAPPFGKEPQPGGELVLGGREGYRRAHTELLALHGVGPKVADCVCLFGLGWSESVPVDTHVWQIAQRDYKFGRGKHSSLTPATYTAVANHFRNLWGKEAGWAHSVLFTADLRAFSKRAVVKTEVEEETIVKEEEILVKEEKILVKEEEMLVKEGEILVKKEKDDTVAKIKKERTIAKRKRVKNEPGENEQQILEVKDEVNTRSKRRRI